MDPTRTAPPEPEAGAELVIVGGERIPELAALAPLAEAIFGARRRVPGWFARKLVREGVEAELCALGLAGAPRAEAVQAYVLLGAGDPRRATARGSGVGVHPSLRGRGLGPKLLDFACARARAAGFEAVEFLASPARRDWYLRQGFEAVREELTLQAPATGSAPQTPDGRELELGEDLLWSWIPEFWQRTPSRERGSLELELLATGVRARAWISREGQAHLVQRLELQRADSSRDDRSELARAAAESLRAALPAGAPVLLYPCPAQQPWVQALLDAGWRAVQRAFVLRRRA